MLTRSAADVLKMLNNLTGSTDQKVTYVIGKPHFCLWSNSNAICDFSKYDDEIDSIMDMLDSVGAIKWIRDHVFRLTQIGLHYDELQKLERKERWKERICGFVSGVLVTVIGVVLSRILL